MSEFNRKKPLYRLFNLFQEEDGRAEVWFTVEADNTPGRELTEAESAAVWERLHAAPWRWGFYNAFVDNMKATIYEPFDINAPIEPEVTFIATIAAPVDTGPVRNASWYFWKFVHNFLIHPFLAFPYEPRWAIKAHDWTSKKCLGGG